jgi:hypothetical protein
MHRMCARAKSGASSSASPALQPTRASARRNRSRDGNSIADARRARSSSALTSMTARAKATISTPGSVSSTSGPQASLVDGTRRPSITISGSVVMSKTRSVPNRSKSAAR